MITFNCSHRKITTVDYTPALDEAINNFKVAGTIRVSKGKVFIQYVSSDFFQQLVARKTPITITYQL